MTNLLQKIISQKHIEVAELKFQKPHLERIVPRSDRRPFFELFSRSPGVVIAEIKPKSPSKGQLITDAAAVAALYAASEADCISVLTDKEFFGGSPQLLSTVRECAPQPVFRKDFIVDTYQIYESVEIGADAILLIAAILDTETLQECIETANQLHLGYLVEVHTEEELRRALACNAAVIGINNRNLDTLEIDLNTTRHLIQLIPEHVIVVSESGIERAADVKSLQQAGVDGILVGTAILTAANPLAKITELKYAFHEKK
jgi:indole-3-glycerol phosphate synthase